MLYPGEDNEPIEDDWTREMRAEELERERWEAFDEGVVVTVLVDDEEEDECES